MGVCLWVFMLFMMGWFLQCVLFFAIRIILRIRWYVCRCFFHSFASFLGRNPPCFAVLGVNSGSVCDAHVSSSVVDISLVRISSVSHADSHCGGESCAFEVSRFVRFSVVMEFFSKKDVWNFSMFVLGMGLSIMIWLLVGGFRMRLSSKLFGMCRWIG